MSPITRSKHDKTKAKKEELTPAGVSNEKHISDIPPKKEESKSLRTKSTPSERLSTEDKKKSRYINFSNILL